MFASLALLRAAARAGLPRWTSAFTVFGKVPFFFYLVHFWVLGVAAAIVHRKVGLGATCGIWLALLLAMAPLCAWYYRKKTERPNWVTRYL